MKTKQQTIVLAGMPNLEWAAENLTGHGGTEIDGRWYYTWEQAMSAAEEVGDGWRLPTIEEFQQLAALGSTWDAERKGRVFGGELFLTSLHFNQVCGGDAHEGDYWSAQKQYCDEFACDFYFTKDAVDAEGINYVDHNIMVRLVRAAK